MKPLRPNVHLLQQLFGFAGLVFAAAISQAVTLYSNNFEGAEATAVANGAGGGVATVYAYGNQGGWNQVLTGGATDSYWWYSTKYATTGGAGALGRPDPLGPASPPYDANGQGSTALHGINDLGFRYATRVLGDAFSPGVYKLSLDVTTDNGLTGQGVWLYLFDGSATPTDFDAQSYSAVGFLEGGTGTPGGTPAGSIGNIVAPVFSSTTNEGNWQPVSYEFTPNASTYGKPIGLGIYMRSQTAVDNVRLEFTPVPEPATGAFALGALVFFARRRRSE